MSSKKKKSFKIRSKKGGNARSLLKKVLLKRKELILPVIFLALGLSMIPIGIIFSMGTQTISDENTIKTNFSRILLNVKADLEGDFQELLDEMEKDPLNGLYLDKMPTPEEIFFAEWANDWFPEVSIPLLGDYIESIGASMVGDINLDEQLPEADLNVSSHLNPSGISQHQCQELWNPLGKNALVSTYPSIWFSVSEGNYEEIDVLKIAFNLSQNQIDLVCNWIVVSQSSWMIQFAQLEVPAINPLFLFGLLGPGIALIIYGVFKLRSEILKGKKPNQKKLKSKSKNIDKVSEDR